MKTLLAFTGGIETAYIAWKVLTETSDDLTCVFLHVVDTQGVRQFDGDIHQYNKILPLVEELRKIRSFSFIKKQCQRAEITEELNHYYPFFINFAAPYLNSGAFDRIATGRTWEQAGQKILADPNLMGSPSSIAGQRLFDKLVTRGNLWNPLVTHDYKQNFTKAHAIQELPPEILSKTFSCVTPMADEYNNLHACGVCFKCLQIRNVNEKLAIGMTPEQIDDWRIQKSYEYGGGNVMAPFRYWIYLEMGIEVPPNAYRPNFKNKNEVIEYVQNNSHYSTKYRKNEGIWEGLV